MALTVESICNSALRRVKYPTPIGSIYEGSRASRVALDFYGVTRDFLFRTRDWEFTKQTVSLGKPLKTAPVSGYAGTPWSTAFPMLPWIYEYAYPAGCIEVKSLLPAPNLIPEQMPRYVLFEKANDPSLATPAPVILTNQVNAFAMITATVNDPNQWTDPGFLEALIEALAEVFALNLPIDPNQAVLAQKNADTSEFKANARQG